MCLSEVPHTNRFCLSSSGWNLTQYGTLFSLNLRMPVGHGLVGWLVGLVGLVGWLVRGPQRKGRGVGGEHLAVQHTHGMGLGDGWAGRVQGCVEGFGAPKYAERGERMACLHWPVSVSHSRTIRS